MVVCPANSFVFGGRRGEGVDIIDIARRDGLSIGTGYSDWTELEVAHLMSYFTAC